MKENLWVKIKQNKYLSKQLQKLNSKLKKECCSRQRMNQKGPSPQAFYCGLYLQKPQSLSY